MSEVVEDRLAVDQDKAARLNNMSVRRLAAWDARGFIRPSVKRKLSDRNTVRLYGFGELVEIRVALALMKEHLSLPHVERLIHYLRDARGFAQPLQEITFAVVDRKIYFQTPDGNWEGEDRPRQIVFYSVLNLEIIREAMRGALEEDRRAQRQVGIEKRRKVLGHKDVFKGTRTPVTAVQEYLEEGYSDEEILQAYPHLTREDIELARSLATSA